MIYLKNISKKQSETLAYRHVSDCLGLVDDKRLELLTSRTSSGCATSCANRPDCRRVLFYTRQSKFVNSKIRTINEMPKKALTRRFTRKAAPAIPTEFRLRRK